VINALQVGRAQGLVTIGLTGRSGGGMRSVCDVPICVPYDRTPEIQERHMAVYHTICGRLEEVFFSA
jgi:D-sedoheptulose 7-phosphate isomerase